MVEEKREQVYIWVTWLSKLIAGESQCEYASWYRAHFKASKKSGSAGFNLVKWTINHNELLHIRRDELEANGYKVFVEDQNSFKLDLTEKYGCSISGKIDILALLPKPPVFIEDCKTGRCKNSDQVQVMLYMMFFPLARDEFKNIQFDGAVVYKDSIVPITAEDVDEDLREVVWKLVGRISQDDPARRVPSIGECKWCDISNCPARME